MVRHFLKFKKLPILIKTLSKKRYNFGSFGASKLPEILFAI